jgi:hypothetical protein
MQFFLTTMQILSTSIWTQIRSDFAFNFTENVATFWYATDANRSCRLRKVTYYKLLEWILITWSLPFLVNKDLERLGPYLMAREKLSVKTQFLLSCYVQELPICTVLTGRTYRYRTRYVLYHTRYRYLPYCCTCTRYLVPVQYCSL